MTLDSYEQKLLSGWEDIYKQGQLTLWIMLALKESPKHMAEIKQFISHYTNDVLKADDQSMYRALRRYHEAELVEYKTEASSGGPDRKVYSLSRVGYRVMQQFLERNIIKTIYSSHIKQLVERS